MKTTATIVTVLAAASIAAAAPTPTNPDTSAELQKKEAKPIPAAEDSFSHVLVEREEPPNHVVRAANADTPAKRVMPSSANPKDWTKDETESFLKNFCGTQ